MNRDLHNNIVPAVALEIAEISTDTTTNGEIIDLKGFDSCEFIFQTGTVTDGDYTVLIQEGDEAALGDAAAVDNADLLGTEAGASFTADTDDDQWGKIGYIGNKRYVRFNVVSANTSSGAYVGAVVIKGHPIYGAKTTQQS